MPNYINWHGVSSATLGIRVQRFPNHNRPIQKFEQVSVPGRNGDLFFFQDAWNNYEQQYEIFAGTGARGNTATTFDAVMSWLRPANASVTVNNLINLRTGGYYHLIDTYEPNTIRLAALTSGVEIADSWTRYGTAVLTFNCRPERFTSDAFTMTSKTLSGGYISNPTDRPAKPFLKVYGSGSGTLTVNGYRISITGMVDYLHIDCDSQNCFRQVTENRNNLITLTNGFPILSPSVNNTISWTGGITKVDIYPRWWRL